MPRPARSTIEGQVYNDLRNLARRETSSTDQIMIEYVLERFLYRMSRSSLGSSCFVLKGGLLLAQFGARRATRDIDILGRLTPHDQAEISRRIAEIARADASDGVTFDPSALRISLIREDSRHGGLRLTMPVAISRAQLKQGDEITSYPESFTDVVALVMGFADPLIAGEVTGRYWLPTSGWAQ
jgi:hypothetical protein